PPPSLSLKPSQFCAVVSCLRLPLANSLKKASTIFRRRRLSLGTLSGSVSHDFPSPRERSPVQLRRLSLARIPPNRELLLLPLPSVSHCLHSSVWFIRRRLTKHQNSLNGSRGCTNCSGITRPCISYV
uniref:Uncharacterized protein n=1 Tax=Cucumis melo TaxID=3656 RepID=A0A9I9CNF7_CUCME